MLVCERSDPLEVKLSKQLWAAVFQLAIDDAVSDRHGAREWIYEDRHEPGSFTWLCELFGYDPHYIELKIVRQYK